jgi:hypothetical protein
MKTSEGFLIIYSIYHRSSFLDAIPLKEQILRVKDLDVCGAILLIAHDYYSGDDPTPQREVSPEDGERLAQTHNMIYYEACARTGHNVDKIYLEAARAVLSASTAVPPPQSSRKGRILKIKKLVGSRSKGELVAINPFEQKAFNISLHCGYGQQIASVIFEITEFVERSHVKVKFSDTELDFVVQQNPEKMGVLCWDLQSQYFADLIIAIDQCSTSDCEILILVVSVNNLSRESCQLFCDVISQALCKYLDKSCSVVLCNSETRDGVSQVLSTIYEKQRKLSTQSGSLSLIQNLDLISKEIQEFIMLKSRAASLEHHLMLPRIHLQQLRMNQQKLSELLSKLRIYRGNPKKFKQRQKDLMKKLSALLYHDETPYSVIVANAWSNIIFLRLKQPLTRNQSNNNSWPNSLDANALFPPGYPNSKTAKKSQSVIKHLLKIQKNFPMFEHMDVISSLIDLFRQYQSIKARNLPTELSVMYLKDSGSDKLLNSEASSLLGNWQLQKDPSSAGTSVVHSLGGIHFKRDPHAPGVEFMVSSLGDLISQQGSAPTELIRVVDPNGIPIIYQASLTVVGRDLQSIIKYTPEYIPKLNSFNFSSLVVLGILSDPQDGKPDNYMVEFTLDDSGEVVDMHIIGIDNDVAFSDVAIIRHQQGINEGKHFINIKNVLYFFPQMQEPIDPKFVSKFLALNPEIVLLTWLEILDKKNVEYQSLLNNGIFTPEDFHGGKSSKRGLQLPIKVVPGTVGKLYKKLLVMHSVLKSNPAVTLNELLKQVEPQVAAHYANVQREHPDSIMDCITALYEENVSDWQNLKQIRSDVSVNLTASMTSLVLRTASEFGFEDNRTLPIRDSIEEFLTIIDYSKFSLGCDAKDRELLWTVISRMSTQMFGKHPLLKSAEKPELFPMCKWILDNKLADVNTTTAQKYSALHVAYKANNQSVITLLLSCKADPNLQTSLGKIPSDYAHH